MFGRTARQTLRFRAGILVTLTAIGVKLAGFRRCLHSLEWLARALPPADQARPDPELAQQLADLVDDAARNRSIYPARCLPRSLVLYYYLLRHGQQPELKLGVQTITGRFRGHAWVECNGFELNEDPPAKELFVPFDWTAPGAGEKRA